MASSCVQRHSSQARSAWVWHLRKPGPTLMYFTVSSSSPFTLQHLLNPSVQFLIRTSILEIYPKRRVRLVHIKIHTMIRFFQGRDHVLCIKMAILNWENSPTPQRMGLTIPFGYGLDCQNALNRRMTCGPCCRMRIHHKTAKQSISTSNPFLIKNSFLSFVSFYSSPAWKSPAPANRRMTCGPCCRMRIHWS